MRVFKCSYCGAKTEPKLCFPETADSFDREISILNMRTFSSESNEEHPRTSLSLAVNVEFFSLVFIVITTLIDDPQMNSRRLAHFLIE